MSNGSQRRRNAPPVNMNAEALNEALDIIGRSESTTYRRKQFSGLTGELAARDYIRRTYGRRIRREVSVPRRGKGSIPILDVVFELDNGEFVVAEAKAGNSKMGTVKADFYELNNAGEWVLREKAYNVPQFSPEWFTQRLDEIAETDRRLANRLRHAWSQGKLTPLEVYARRPQKFTATVSGRNVRYAPPVDVENLNPAFDVVDRSAEWDRWHGVESQRRAPGSVNAATGGTAVEATSVAARVSPVEHVDVAPSGAVAEAGHIAEAAPAAESRLVGDFNKATHAGVKVRTLAVGAKAWRMARTLGGIAFACFVPLTIIDVVLEVAFAFWDWKQRKEEKQQRERQKALEAVLEEKTFYGMRLTNKVESLIQKNIFNHAQVFEQFMRNWDVNRRSAGFWYVRVSALVQIEKFYDLMNHEIEDLTRYYPGETAVYLSLACYDFRFDQLGGEEPGQMTEADKKRLHGQGYVVPEVMRKKVQKVRLGYTIIPPMLTPFDVVVTKINNLFLDILTLTTSFMDLSWELFRSPNGEPVYDKDISEDGFEFTSPLNNKVCHYCLAYLYWAAGHLSRHPLTQQDLEGNLENAKKGRERRRELLLVVLEGRRTKHGKSFRYMVERLNDLVDPKERSEEAAAAVRGIYAAGRMICLDLERIRESFGRAEYYYMGPNYVAAP